MVSYIMQKAGKSVQLDTIEEGVLPFDSGCRRKSTADCHYRAIRNAIMLMHEQFAEPLTLQDMADAAQLSPFHFNRLFRRTTGLSPMIFLSAIRLQQAKYLLMTTRDTITGICFDVGYRSLGTFTTRFTSLVGLPPSHYRRLLDDSTIYLRPLDIRDAIQAYVRQQENGVNPRVKGTISGTIRVTHPFHGLIFVGLFASPLPQEMPVSCAILTNPGYFTLPPVGNGQYYLFAAALDSAQCFLDVVTYGFDQHGCAGRQPIKVSNGVVKGHCDVTISPATWVHPPVLTALPWLLFSHFASGIPSPALGRETTQVAW